MECVYSMFSCIFEITHPLSFHLTNEIEFDKTTLIAVEGLINALEDNSNLMKHLDLKRSNQQHLQQLLSEQVDR